VTVDGANNLFVAGEEEDLEGRGLPVPKFTDPYLLQLIMANEKKFTSEGYVAPNNPADLHGSNDAPEGEYDLLYRAQNGKYMAVKAGVWTAKLDGKEGHCVTGGVRIDLRFDKTARGYHWYTEEQNGKAAATWGFEVQASPQIDQHPKLPVCAVGLFDSEDQDTWIMTGFAKRKQLNAGAKR
jgi:hypothetical protein